MGTLNDIYTVQKSEGFQQKAGVFHSPKQFLSMAKTVQHPMDSLDHWEGPRRYALDFNLERLHPWWRMTSCCMTSFPLPWPGAV